jgi:hypothetical protein
MNQADATAVRAMMSRRELIWALWVLYGNDQDAIRILGIGQRSR